MIKSHYSVIIHRQNQTILVLLTSKISGGYIKSLGKNDHKLPSENDFCSYLVINSTFENEGTDFTQNNDIRIEFH